MFCYFFSPNVRGIENFGRQATCEKQFLSGAKKKWQRIKLGKKFQRGILKRLI
jgi:hypothetical protein